MTAFRRLWDTLAPIGRDRTTGGYLRFAWSEPELACRAWLTDQAARRGLTIDDDGNGNLFAWWGDPAAGGAVLTGSHFDSVPQGGGYDGPLGIVSGLLAIDLLRERGASLRRPVGIVAFAEEEGARFGVPCLGSRLLTGALDPQRAAALTDREGDTLAHVAGVPPVGARPDLLRRISCFVELHIEQGRLLDDLDERVGLATGIWPHGRWRLEFAGVANHAGTTAMTDRKDPVLAFASTVLAADEEARRRGGHATIGRVEIGPNATNAVASLVRAWLDARAEDAATLAGLVAAVSDRAAERAGRDRTCLTVTPESYSGAVEFDPALGDRLRGALAAVQRGPAHSGPAHSGPVPMLATAAGHDAGVLAAHLPTTMLFVRNPTGVSHAPAEEATDDDCMAGVEALATVLEELACR